MHVQVKEFQENSWEKIPEFYKMANNDNGLSTGPVSIIIGILNVIAIWNHTI